jgi:superoxide dismutase, Cu-Zn family
MIRRTSLALLIAFALAGCDRSDPVEPVATGATSAASTAPAATPPVTDPATSPAPAGTMPTAPTPAGTLPTDPVAPVAGAAPTAAGATVSLQPASGSSVSGVIDFMAEEGGIHLGGRIAGLTPGAQHGFHVHETGDCSAPDASSAGGHFNPGGDMHGKHDAPSHHAGDLPSVDANDAGEADLDFVIPSLEIGSGGPRDIIGRALVVHAQPDDFTTQPDGAAGTRIGCGVIVRR